MDSPIFKAVRRGRVLELERDPDPDLDAASYMVVEGPAFLVLFPDEELKRAPSEQRPDPRLIPAPERNRDHNEQIRHAFAALSVRVPPTEWTSSSTPYTDLTDGFRSLAAQEPVAEDVRAYLDANVAVAQSIEMLYTSMAMSARAEWRQVPEPHRGVAARGWFLGRWLPTFLVLDGPILRFLNSPVFRRQTQPPSSLLRSVRRFFKTDDFMNLRHAFAHWSFRWEVVNGDSVVVGTHDGSSHAVRVSRAEADAFHIITFALIEAIDDVFVRPRRSAPERGLR